MEAYSDKLQRCQPNRMVSLDTYPEVTDLEDPYPAETMEFESTLPPEYEPEIPMELAAASPSQTPTTLNQLSRYLGVAVYAPATVFKSSVKPGPRNLEANSCLHDLEESLLLQSPAASILRRALGFKKVETPTPHSRKSGLVSGQPCQAYIGTTVSTPEGTITMEPLPPGFTYGSNGTVVRYADLQVFQNPKSAWRSLHNNVVTALQPAGSPAVAALHPAGSQNITALQPAGFQEPCCTEVQVQEPCCTEVQEPCCTEVQVQEPCCTEVEEPCCTEVEEPCCTEVQVQEPCCTEVQVQEPCCTEVQVQEPCCTEVQVQEPCCTEVQVQEPCCTEVQVQEPCCTEVQVQEPCCTEVQVQEPCCTEVQVQEPCCTEVQVQEPRCTEVQVQEPCCTEVQVQEPCCTEVQAQTAATKTTFVDTDTAAATLPTPGKASPSSEVLVLVSAMAAQVNTLTHTIQDMQLNHKYLQSQVQVALARGHFSTPDLVATSNPIHQDDSEPTVLDSTSDMDPTIPYSVQVS
uniref:Uncharacterized protein n=1 Tax=Leptobrachium leishanense TaxID=445787 RepID=A0A8C5Q2I0_9ANUR